MNKQVAVIGLGRFGFSVASTLSRLGAEVLAVDVDENRVRDIAPLVTTAVQADATDENNVKDLGLTDFDVVVVAMGDFEASLMVTLHLKQLGCDKVVVKASSDQHGKILERVGADSIVFPEKDMGERLAFSLISGSIIDHIEFSPEYSVFEVVIAGAFARRSLRSLDLRNRMGITVVALKRQGTVSIFVDPDEPLREGDTLVVIGPQSSIQKLSDAIDGG